MTASPLLDHATAITADADRGHAVRLSTTVDLAQPADRIATAELSATAHGVYEASINGLAVTESVLNPGWTSYEWRVQVQRFDVAELLAGATQARIDVVLGNGWYRGDLAFEGANATYGTELALLAELVITYTDGTQQRIGTSPQWAATSTEITANNLYQGQTIDARLRGAEPTVLTTREVAFDKATLVEQVGPLITRHETIRPVAIWSSPSGKTLLDFGQNVVGWLRLRVQGEAGTEITLRHAEVLEDDELGTRPLRGARATDCFVLSGGLDTFEPTLTFHGFRYAEVTGFPGRLSPVDVEAVVVHSDLERTGWFSSSHPGLNQLIANSVWGQKGNFLDVPTDCPQRDERLGWTGDLAAYAATAAYQFDVADFLHKWLLDLQVEANDVQRIPYVVPDVLKFVHFDENPAGSPQPTAVWGDAAAWVPEALWHAYGDRERLEAHYPGMVSHLESVEPLLSPTGLWDTGFQFGDWLDPDASPHAPADAKADKGVVATASLFRSAAFTAEVATLLGRDNEAARWSALAARLRDAFVEHYVHDDGTITSDCATVYALAICFGLLDEQQQRAAGDRLAQVVAERDYVVTTGFAGTPFVTWALSETGHIAEAYRLLLESANPSWLYPVSMGATTIWERWDSMMPDGTINAGEMTSFNHYALGAVADWVYQVIAGIRPAEPGYAKLRLQPTPGEGLDWAHGALQTRHGRVESGWRRGATPGSFLVEVVVPEGVPAEVVLPDGRTETVGAGRHRFPVTVA